MRKKTMWISGVLVLAWVGAACGDGGDEPTVGTREDPRTIEIAALDELAFDPASIEVEVGETVRLVVTNAGELDHELVVGDLETQEMAEGQAMAGDHEHMVAMASLAVAPGEIAEATVTFDEVGELLYACHVAGHYRGGMVGTISVG